MKYARMSNSTVVETAHDAAYSTFNLVVKEMFQPCPEHIERNWKLIDGDWVEPDPIPETEPVYKPLTRLEFETHAQTAANLTDLEFLAALQDPNLALLWHRVSIAERVERDNDLTQNGLNSMVAAGHLTEEQVEAINDSWPTEEST
jgi:hypothetical protein